jgi:hypothetical protein
MNQTNLIKNRPAFYGLSTVLLCMESGTPWRDTAWAMSQENVDAVRRSN